MEKLETLLLIFLGLGALVGWWLVKARATTARERLERPPRPDVDALSENEFYKKMLLMQAQNAATPQDEARPAVAPQAPVPNWWRGPWGGLRRRKTTRP